ncbi:ricin B lectin domain-containing protein [Dichomitus squalens]|uniref:Ricin B lectin domain-containing protein n=1 Tax=Dichomitus squalens TaxID=114155 RepID=A0A4Q9MJ72_9APHY|nr:ricin B lectin domain-containing protein [Dichomitus squalens]TBU38316.1 ricin B lectin domain-containing protein [Dichomitus squalens]TBU54270.1 ricin B lectin domain-containing protein [Dichomitus squalens]
MWTPGTYVLLNARAGTAMDLHGYDYTSIIGYPMHGGPNQQWEFIPSGHGYVIRCVRSAKAGHALYLTVEGGVRNNAPVVANAYPVTWSVEQTEDGIRVCRISWPNSNFVFDLADWGDSTPGTRIQLMPLVPGELCQLWHYTRCAPAEREHEKGMDVEVQSERAVSHPATTETVTLTEESGFVTTTRTTTTTVLTTVTEVTRTPNPRFRPQAHPQNQHKNQQPQRRSIGYR